MVEMNEQEKEIEVIARRMAEEDGSRLPWHVYMPDASKEFVEKAMRALEEDEQNPSV